MSLLPTPPPEYEHEKSNFLVASPYTDLAHLLDLATLSPPCQLIATALTAMQAVTDSYATTAYEDAFNWADVVARLAQLAEAGGYTYPETSFYVIVFRSRVPHSTSRAYLGDLDAETHREAVASGGLLKYWFGTPDKDGRNLATCLWRNRSDAKRGGAGKGHAQAMLEVRGLYLEWRVERLRFIVGEGAKSWRIVQWED
ncbi:hypothetical protein FN846DRAFT_628555 [Sphaerosporella brunnea]|uniref:Uncharacterized protein n=1 Tax=Sphaerosporella brunnea TaxID=1250544 RepID=A0A5J5F187_9PEZI|nr:hypothetical protein FN846DRAFT_628555 [Sphaerosporella brunnea]